jgi:hypothetical protein
MELTLIVVNEFRGKKSDERKKDNKYSTKARPPGRRRIRRMIKP